MVVPYVGMDVPLAAVKVREVLKSGNCCCALEAGMMDTQAPVSIVNEVLYGRLLISCIHIVDQCVERLRSLRQGATTVRLVF